MSNQPKPTNAELRELDAQIAERLFGWVWLRHTMKFQQLPKTAGKWRTEWRRSLFIPNHGCEPYDTPEGTVYVPANGDEEIGVMNAPHYSSSWYAAAEVIEKMRERNWMMALYYGMNMQGIYEWSVEFVEHDGKYMTNRDAKASASTGPEAIARAALESRGGRP